MSEMEYNKGKLTPRPPLTEEEAKSLAESKGEDNHRRYNNYIDMVMDDLGYYDESLEVISGNLYKVEFEHRGYDLCGFEKASVDSDGVISFETYHYNGGGCWTEVVEDALKNGNAVY